MTCRVIEWGAASEPVGACVAAVGVFDGVHLGHQALIASATARAAQLDVPCVAVTFDRDPDRVITPEAAAPQLLSLDEKVRYLAQAGADVVLVIAFCREVADLTPEAFLTDIFLDALDPLAVYVGHDFRFGHMAAGDVDTLRRFGEVHRFEVVDFELFEADGAPVTSTRIRALVAAGDVAGAAGLLGRAHRVDGVVVHGRGEGTELGVATANVEPEPQAALPGAGVYAGRVEATGGSWPAAISVGVPPMFPQATDVLEAHLIGFAGDLYGKRVTVEFTKRLRDQRRFDGVGELMTQIRDDIDRAAQIGALSAVEPAEDGPLDDEFVDDPEALAAAEAAVRAMPEPKQYVRDDSWVAVFGPQRLSSLVEDGGSQGAIVAGPLADAGIRFSWDPMPPEHGQTARPDFNWLRTFTLYVPAQDADAARELLRASGVTVAE